MHYTDQLGRTVELATAPQRIISLVPSQTELLFDLELNERVVGITKFCVHPKDWYQSKSRVGGTKQVNIDKVIALNPDLIIANKEENLKSDIEALEKIAPVWVSDINDLEAGLNMMIAVGEITDTLYKAQEIAGKIQQGFNSLKQLVNGNTTKDCVYLIWRQPYMTVGADTFINDMFKYCKFNNVFASKTRYPEITIEDMQAANPQLVLLSSEPYPFKQKHIDELQQHLPNAQIILVDGEMFSWYGSRLIKSAQYFNEKMAVLFK